MMFTWSHEIDTWIVIIGVMCAVACALLGNFLVLRRMSMMGDAISHAVLPGLAVAFLLTGNRTSVAMFAGAAVVGVLTAVFTQWISGAGRVDRGAAMGVVFTTLFAIGLILIVRGADKVDLDPGCVLYGAIELAPLDLVSVAGWSIPRPVVVLACVLLLNLTIVVTLFKELRISSFDPELATTLGINATLMHYLLMTLVAITTVAAFESIGSIIVIAMLIVPPAAAHLLTERLGAMIVVSAVIAAASAALGHVAAIAPLAFGLPDSSTAGMMAVMAGALFTIALLAAPRHGLISKLYHRAALSLRIVQEDVLGLLYRLDEVRGEMAMPSTSMAVRETLEAPPLLTDLALRRLERQGKIRRDSGQQLSLTRLGLTEATSLVRTHRLWELYLQRHLHLPEDHLHAAAERLEHLTDARMQARLDKATERPTHDPHGKEVPPAVDESA